MQPHAVLSYVTDKIIFYQLQAPDTELTSLNSQELAANISPCTQINIYPTIRLWNTGTLQTEQAIMNLPVSISIAIASYYTDADVFICMHGYIYLYYGCTMHICMLAIY